MGTSSVSAAEDYEIVGNRFVPTWDGFSDDDSSVQSVPITLSATHADLYRIHRGNSRLVPI